MSHEPAVGELHLVDDETYNGQWKKDYRHGTGHWNSSDGDVYKGEWFDDLKHGHGELQLVSGARCDTILKACVWWLKVISV